MNEDNRLKLISLLTLISTIIVALIDFLSTYTH